uniref:Uncharacterized protein n=1 Tax=Setaria viridis TaxID=4556 RepID=A0A4U6T5I2_SETVI|nr:hypothetical protein SEVIR_9G467450v2 [Setaria viridis]
MMLLSCFGGLPSAVTGGGLLAFFKKKKQQKLCHII